MNSKWPECKVIETQNDPNFTWPHISYPPNCQTLRHNLISANMQKNSTALTYLTKGTKEKVTTYLSCNISSRQIIPRIWFSKTCRFCLCHHLTKGSITGEVVENITQSATAVNNIKACQTMYIRRPNFNFNGKHDSPKNALNAQYSVPGFKEAS